MLSAFPQLFNFADFAILGLRLAFALWFLWSAYEMIFNTKGEFKNISPSWLSSTVAGASAVIGMLSLIGLFTQVAVLIGLFLIFLTWYFNMQTKTMTKTALYLGAYTAFVGLMLLFLGPGALAIDLPL